MSEDKYDPYRPLDEKVAKWFMSTIEGLCRKPEAANFGRVRGGIDLEIEIRVAPEDKEMFTPEVCAALATLLRVASGFLAPVVYLEGSPHRAAMEAISECI